jgi:amidase
VPVGPLIARDLVEHVITRSVRDTAAVLDVIAGAMPGDPYTAPPPARPYRDEVGADAGRLRIGVRTEAFAGFGAPAAECVAAVEAAAALLVELGHDVAEGAPSGIDDPALTDAFLPCFASWVADDVATLERMGGEPVHDDDVEPATWALAELGRSVPAVQFLEGLERLRAIGRAVCAWWDEGNDLLLTPTLVEPPPVLGRFDDGGVEAIRFAAYTIPFNVSGQPAVSLPLHWTHDGLPVGVQLVAAPWREDVLLRVAAQLEAARPWADRRPPVFAGS